MADFALDENGDLILSTDSPDIQMVTGDEELLQECRIVLETRLGEFEPDKELGLSHDNLFGKFIDKDGLEQDIDNAFSEQLPEVDSVTVDSINFSPEKREMVVKITIQSAILSSGEATLEAEVNADAE